MLQRINTVTILFIILTAACHPKSKPSETTPAQRQPAATTASVPPGPAVERLLQGNWQSLTDANETFTISGARKIITQANQSPLSLAFAYRPDCGSTVCAVPKGRYGCVTTTGEFDVDCQAIVHISATELEVTQGNAGKTTRYKKIQ